MQQAIPKAPRAALLVLALTLAVLVLGPVPARAATPFADVLTARHLVASMLAALSDSADLEKSAIVTDLDDEAQAYADKARRRLDDLRAAERELSVVLARMSAPKEATLLADFDVALGEYLKLSDRILALAVQNTNDKATRLSKERGLPLLAELEKVLSGLTPADSQACALQTEAQGLLLSAYKIQSLLPLHIAEIDEKVMDALEARIKADEAQAQAHVDKLSTLAGTDAAAASAHIRNLVGDYAGLVREILVLSRQNTDVQSMALALGQNRLATARCMELLDALQALLLARGTKATR